MKQHLREPRVVNPKERMMDKRREILSNNFEGYETNEDIKQRIDQALSELSKLDLSEEEIKEEIAHGIFIGNKVVNYGLIVLGGIIGLLVLSKGCESTRRFTPLIDTSAVQRAVQ